MALERLGAAAHQQNPALVHNHRAHANQRRHRKLSLHVFSYHLYDSASTG
jgi:hypothetical protein